MRLTIKKKISLFLILPGFFFFSLFMYYSIMNTESIMYSLHQKSYAEQVRGYADLANTYLTQTSNNAAYTANVIEEFGNLTEKEIFSILLDNIEQAEIIFGSTIAFSPYSFNKHKKFYAPFVYRTDKGVIKTTIESDYTNFKWYDIPRKIYKPFWTEPYYSNVIKGLKLVSYCVPIIKKGEFIGVVTIDYSLESFNKIFKAEFEHDSTRFIIITSKGQYISHPQKGKILERNVFDKNEFKVNQAFKKELATRMIEGESGFIVDIDETNKTFWGFFAPIPISNWSIIVFVYENELNGPIKRVFYNSFLIMAVTVLFSFLFLTFIVKRGLKPLLELRDFSKQIRDGNYNAKIRIKANDEISDLAEDLNIMGEQLAKREKELIEINENLEKKVEERTLELQRAKESTDKIIDTSPMPIAVTDIKSGEVIRTNMAMAEFHKTSLEEVYKTKTPDWYWDNSQREKILNFLKTDGKLINFEMEGKRFGTKEKRWVLLSLFPIQYLERDAFIVVLSDITEIKEANIKIHSQNIEISTRNKYISDSINYAKRIQNSILPSETYLKELFPSYFLIFKPKDVVSGDFYWVSKVGDKKIIAAVDCTGHGVPGALMSMIGNTLLNEIVNFGHETNPATILNKLNDRVNEELNKNVNHQTYDGMDAAIAVIDEHKKTLEYSGAYRPLNYFKDGKFFILKGDRKSIGDTKKQNIQFTYHKIELNETVVFYLYSDGYVDQHNTQNKKFGSKRFQKLLEQINTLDINEQKQILLNELEDHRGAEVQRDDITILGIKPLKEKTNLDAILFSFTGEFTHSKIIEISEKVNTILEKKFDNKVVRTVHFCGNELMQNIGFYSEDKNESGIGSYSVEFNHSENKITIVCSNISSKNNIQKFRERIDNYNSLNQDELKILYKEKLKSESDEGSKGAGIGLIQILRKTKNKIDYITKSENDNLSSITLKIRITV